METIKCKSKKCQRSLPEGYKHKYCENCRNRYVKQIKDGGKTVVSIALFVGATALSTRKKGEN